MTARKSSEVMNYTSYRNRINKILYTVVKVQSHRNPRVFVVVVVVVAVFFF